MRAILRRTHAPADVLRYADVVQPPGSNVVETYVKYLRRKLDALGPPLIRTVRSVGYMLDEFTA